jgi:hypothetical protein
MVNATRKVSEEFKLNNDCWVKRYTSRAVRDGCADVVVVLVEVEEGGWKWEEDLDRGGALNTYSRAGSREEIAREECDSVGGGRS